METQLLLYHDVVPISVDRHLKWAANTGSVDYHFAADVNALPLTAVEIPLAAREYSIVFAGNETAVMPAVILGVRGQRNLYVQEDGSWDATYIPAFARRYPFVFSQTPDGKTFTLCIDEDWKGWSQDGQGERLFDDDGNKTEYVDRVLKFLQEYQGHFDLTQAYCKRLQELDLLKPMQAQVNIKGGGQHSLTGFQTVDREKLKQLSGEQLSKLAKNDELELTYIHLQSLNNFPAVAERVAKDAKK